MVNDNKSIKEIFEKAMINYLEAYFVKRDFQATISFLSDDLTGFGTGFDEYAYKKEAFLRLYQRDLEDVQSPITYTFIHKKIVLLSERIAIASCQMNIHGQVNKQNFSLNHLRQSLVLTLRDDGKVKIEHKHISFPTDVHEEGEAYPLKEIGDITKNLESMVNEKTRTIMEAYKELEIAVITDKLTQVYNRNRLDDILESEVNRSNRYKKIFSFLIGDIDHFKGANDTYGHLAGDKILAEVAGVFKSTIRNTDFAGRWGGDEFVVIFPETQLKKALEITKRIKNSIEKKRFDEDIAVTVSFGLAEFKEGDTPQTLFKRADEALYQAKKKGRDRIIPAENPS